MVRNAIVFGSNSREVREKLLQEVIHAPRRVAFAIKDKVKVQQDRIEDLGVIAKVKKSTALVNSLIVEKPKTGQLRICLDPKDLNQAIMRPHYRMPTFEDRRMDEINENLDGFNVIVDNILVHGQSKEEHDRRLRAMLQRSSEKGIHLNPDKTGIGVHEVSYFGHILSADGIKPDAKKVDAIQKMEAPKDQSDLENDLSKFAPFLSKITFPLGDMLKQDNMFQWDSNAQIAFKKMKNAVTSTDFLAYYDPKKEHISSSACITKWREDNSARQDGVPQEVISHNGTQCTAEEFVNFTKCWGFKHSTSSPHYPQSNGLAEKGVQMAKRLFDKVPADHRDPRFSLLEYNNTPIGHV
ncbi:uncharacterized protein K02A2.6-like [Haliotis rufescens]|uniref:uncharacterized protein K02A2.6-like n=1 Tax=Haliotis rufescens TaxID=6454 RepID=UPI001EAFBBA8|nr:uncharacterized protein K02A2.6-like [Haliotis rufescens]